jgi:hypothetical protein
MLLQVTSAVTLIAMSVTLWMGLYLLARGFPSLMALRVVVVSLALSGFFFSGYNNIFVQVPGTAAIRAVLLVFALGSWYGATYHVMSDRNQVRYRFIEWGVYGLGALSIVFLAQSGAFFSEEGNALYAAHMDEDKWAYRVYGSYQVIVSFGIMLNLLVGDRVGLTQRGKYFLITSIFPVTSVIYGVISLRNMNSPRVIQDVLALCGVLVLGFAVARHQMWTERRATHQDFLLTTISALGVTGITVFFAWKWGMPVSMLSNVAGFVLLSIGVYDLTREFLERSRSNRESKLRKQLRHLESENTDQEALKLRLLEGLDLLCQSMDAPGGFVSVRQEDHFLVMASRSSVEAGSVLTESAVTCEDVSKPRAGPLSSLAWLAPSFEGRKQTVTVGIEKPKSKMDYSIGDLELLAEVTDQIGTILSLNNLRAARTGDLGEASQMSVPELMPAADEILGVTSSHPSDEFVKVVEDALRKLPDTVKLGQSALAEKIPVQGDSHIERGKHLQKLLTGSIEAFKPADKRPPEPLPRVWYNHAVLYDAYVEGVPNREIMARLYISEGTFNRTRRNAIRGLARMLMEKNASP